MTSAFLPLASRLAFWQFAYLIFIMICRVRQAWVIFLLFLGMMLNVVRIHLKQLARIQKHFQPPFLLLCTRSWISSPYTACIYGRAAWWGMFLMEMHPHQLLILWCLGHHWAKDLVEEGPKYPAWVLPEVLIGWKFQHYSWLLPSRTFSKQNL